MNGNTQLYTLMFGARIYPLGHRHKITPFGEVLVGTGLFRLQPGERREASIQFSHWGWATTWMGGGGFDVKFKKRWTIRLIEFDYEHTNFARLMPRAMAAPAREIIAAPWVSFIILA